MKTFGTYFQNDKDAPIKYGEINLINPERQRLRGEPLLEGVEAYPVFQGFCGTDFELMKMGRENNLSHKKDPIKPAAPVTNIHLFNFKHLNIIIYYQLKNGIHFYKR